MDYVFALNGYLADHARIFCLGDLPDDLCRAHDAMLEIQEKVKEMACPGAVSGEIYIAMKVMADAKGFKDAFMGAAPPRIRFAGHGLGIELDEYPFLAQGQTLPLEEGMTIALEPKVVLPGKGVVGIENTCLVTGSGLEALTRYPMGLDGFNREDRIYRTGLETMDKYPDFRTLAAYEKQDQDYRIRIRDRGARISIVVPHGGRIEPGTSMTAEHIAGSIFNWYCFEGIKETDNRDLHIASHRFDEPRALDLIASSDVVVTVHACKDPEQILYLGGRFSSLASVLGADLKLSGIAVSQHPKFKGIHPGNICNLGRLKRGFSWRSPGD